MPTVRKLSADELREMAEQERDENLAAQTFGPPLVPPAPGLKDRLVLQVVPKIGHVVRFTSLDGERSGVVLSFYGDDSATTGVQLLVDGKRRWLTHGIVTQVLGRPRGISRIDHPARRTYGWYVRLYERGVPRLARLFSDGQYAGITASLEAALAFHALCEGKKEQG